MSVQRYGIKVGRLWMRWPYIEVRDVWVGAYVKEAYWEMGSLHRVVYVCPLPMLVFLFDWSMA